jgi:hypothetical protein
VQRWLQLKSALSGIARLLASPSTEVVGSAGIIFALNDISAAFRGFCFADLLAV